MSNLPTEPQTLIQSDAEGHSQIALLPLVIALSICLFVSILPQLLVQEGIANHGAASLLFWAMSAGFIRGVGFIPKHIVPRLLFSTYACLIGVLGAGLLMLL
jgi:predicted membrane protein